MSILDRQWWEQPYLDLWSINHTLMGVFAAAVALVLGVGAFKGCVIVVLIAGAWEAYEHALGISKFEKFTNVVSDIVVALAGYAVGRWLFLQTLGTWKFDAVLGFIVAALIAMAVLGATAYRRYRKSRKNLT